MANVHQMLNNVYQNFSILGEKYPRIKSNLEKCYKDIQAKHSLEQDIPNEKKKEDIKKLLTKFMDMKHLEMSYDGLINETASSEEDLIKLLKNISEVILSYRKKTTLFAARQGKLLKDGKMFLTRLIFKRVQEACGFTPRYCNFLISLNQLFEEYPRLCYCAVPIRTFMSNIKIIRKICEEDCIFWKNTF